MEKVLEAYSRAENNVRITLRFIFVYDFQVVLGHDANNCLG
jgi:hypothetical protein